MRAKRIWVVGNSGAGKSTLAARIASRLGLPHIELDAIHHQADWKPLDRDKFVAEVAARCAADGWVVDGNYADTLVSLMVRADAIVWLDLPRHRVFRQIVWRTLKRVVLRTKLWNGNRERLRTVLHWDPNVSVIMWSWAKHASYVARYERAMRDPAFAHIAFHRLRSHREADRFLQTLAVAR